ncbi:DUF3784 domain-containing protein [Alkalibacterium kapii]|uniref:DUF3784 domain-containing protein n=1 Tax=Alkalibacterium kapii TaxID=426704 RepID=A0A511B022_9LACT|nr:DUF3784 domain-containing protein [Alkalibacterium kapii]GEK91177.1 hypothetical protein AKA01nite_07990 [Alkalibacterium kapii]
MLTYLLIGAILLALGFAVHVLKWNMLIAYSNSKPKAKTNKTNSERFRKIIGIYAYFTGALFLLLAFLEYQGISVPQTPVVSFFVLLTMGVMYYAQKDSNDKN